MLVDVFMKLPSWGKSGAVSFASEIVGGVSIQSALFKHYVGSSAEPFDLGTIPEKWQVWIVNATQARPGPHEITGEQAQKAGLDNLSDTLGHFTVIVTEKLNFESLRNQERRKSRSTGAAQKSSKNGSVGSEKRCSFATPRRVKEVRPKR